MTGPYWTWGGHLARGAELAVDEINAKGGILDRLIQFTALDDAEGGAPNVTLGREKMERLYAEGNLVCIATEHSGVWPHQLQVAKKYGRPLLNCISLNYDPRTKDFYDVGKYSFNFSMDAKQEGVAYGKWAYENMGRKIYIFGADYAMGHTMATAMWYHFCEEQGGTLAGASFAPLGTTDYTPWLEKIRAANPDFVFVCNAGSDSIKFNQQFTEFGLAKEFPRCGMNVTVVESDIPQAAEAFEGYVVMTSYSSTLDIPWNVQFRESYEKRYGETTSNPQCYSYEALHVLKEAIEDVGSLDPNDIIKSLEGRWFDSVEGKRHIRDVDHAVFSDYRIYEVRGGRHAKLLGTIKGEDIEAADKPSLGVSPYPKPPW